jgi:hypothetical protein
MTTQDQIGQEIYDASRALFAATKAADAGDVAALAPAQERLQRAFDAHKAHLATLEKAQ